MTYRLPIIAQVGPLKFRIVRNREADGDHQWGEVNYAAGTINIAELCGPNRLAETLMHELIHAVADGYNVKIEHDDVGRLAMGLTQALQSLGLVPEEMILATDPYPSGESG